MLQSKKKSFNQIKIHSQYSICEGALKIENLKEYCKKNKVQSVGLSDTYNLSGALEFSENISSVGTCLLYTSPSPRDMWTSRMPSSA